MSIPAYLTSTFAASQAAEKAARNAAYAEWAKTQEPSVFQKSDGDPYGVGATYTTMTPEEAYKTLYSSSDNPSYIPVLAGSDLQAAPGTTLESELAKYNAQDPSIDPYWFAKFTGANNAKSNGSGLSALGSFTPGKASADKYQEIQDDRAHAFDSSFWQDLRDTVEAGASIAANYFLPGSSLLTGSMVSKGAQDFDLGNAYLLSGLAGGATGPGWEGSYAALTGNTPPVGSMSPLEGSGSTAVPSTSAMSDAMRAAEKYLTKYLDPSTLAKGLGKQAVGRVASNLIQGRDPMAGIDPKNMLVNTLAGTAAGAVGSGLSSLTGWSPNVTGSLASAGLTALRGGSPTSALVSAGVNAAGNNSGLSNGVLSYLKPIATQLATSKINGTPPANLSSLAGNALTRAVTNNIPLPDLKWPNLGSGG